MLQRYYILYYFGRPLYSSSSRRRCWLAHCTVQCNSSAYFVEKSLVYVISGYAIVLVHSDQSLKDLQNITKRYLFPYFILRSICHVMTVKKRYQLDFYLSDQCTTRVAYLVLHRYGSYTVYPIAKLFSKQQIVSNQNSATISAQNHTFCQVQSICFAIF